MIAVEFDDREFLAGLTQAVADMDVDLRAGAQDRAERIKAGAKARAPKDKGELVASIDVAEGSDEEGWYFEVGTDVDHGTYQEFGTSVVPPHPFMRPSIAENSD